MPLDIRPHPLPPEPRRNAIGELYSLSKSGRKSLGITHKDIRKADESSARKLLVALRDKRDYEKTLGVASASKIEEATKNIQDLNKVYREHCELGRL